MSRIKTQDLYVSRKDSLSTHTGQVDLKIMNSYRCAVWKIIGLISMSRLETNMSHRLINRTMDRQPVCENNRGSQGFIISDQNLLEKEFKLIKVMNRPYDTNDNIQFKTAKKCSGTFIK